MSGCCELAHHLWSLVLHHSGHRPKVMSQAAASLTLYPPCRRVKAEPQTKPPVRREQ